MVNGKWSPIAWFGIGTIVGAVCGMLAAPKSGEEMREDITDAVHKGIKDSKRTTRRLVRQARHVVDRAQEQVQHALHTGG